LAVDEFGEVCKGYHGKIIARGREEDKRVLDSATGETLIDKNGRIHYKYTGEEYDDGYGRSIANGRA
jgi:hypothetical protein